MLCGLSILHVFLNVYKWYTFFFFFIYFFLIIIIYFFRNDHLKHEKEELGRIDQLWMIYSLCESILKCNIIKYLTFEIWLHNSEYM